MGDSCKLKIGDIITLEYGKGLKDYRSGDGKYDVFGTNGKIGLTDEFLYDEPSIIIGRKGAYREVHLAKPPFFVIDTAFYTKKRIKGLDNLYLYFWFKNIDINEMDSGSAIPSTSRDEVYDLDINLPPLPEQKAIASVLSSLDDKIDLLHRQNKTLEATAETLFRQWFVEEVQEDWEVVKLDSLINISSGKGLKKEHLSENGAYPVLGANGEIGRTNEFLFDESLLFTGRVGTLGNIFRVENEKVWLSDNTLVIKPKNCFNFIYFVLKTAKLEEYNVGSTQPLIRQSDIKEIEINLPSENKLNEFEKKSDLLLNKIRQNKSQIRTLEKLRDTLLPKLMSGEVSVKEFNN